MPSVGVHWASPTWFSALHVPLKRGRMFTIADRARRDRRSWSSTKRRRGRFWPNGDPLGKRVGVGQGGFDGWRRGHRCRRRRAAVRRFRAQARRVPPVSAVAATGAHAIREDAGRCGVAHGRCASRASRSRAEISRLRRADARGTRRVGHGTESIQRRAPRAVRGDGARAGCDRHLRRDVARGQRAHA